jgi:hypothetical protein
MRPSTLISQRLTYRESPRDIEINLGAQAKPRYFMVLRCKTVSWKDYPVALVRAVVKDETDKRIMF